MAATGPLRVANAPLGPSYDDQPFDINVLCAKLEVAKREREEREAASALRKQVRQAVRNSKDESRRRPRPPLVIDPHCTHSRSSSYADQACSPRSPHSLGQPLSWADVTINVPEHRNIDESALSPPALDREGNLRNKTVPRSGSNGDASRNHATPPQSTTKRTPFSLFKSQTNDDRTEHEAKGTLLRKDRPEDVAKRRSQTSPLLQTRFNGSKPDQPIDSKRPSMTHAADFQSMNYISEYAVCFDTSPAKECSDDWGMFQSPQSIKPPAPLPIDRPEWAGRRDSVDGMRSLLNLSSMLKKDKKDKSVRASVVELQPPPPPPTDTSQAMVPRSRPHTRSQTAPEDLICEAVKRIEQDQRGKKRRSMGAFLQTILLPSQSHHTMSNAAHCVAI